MTKAVIVFPLQFDRMLMLNVTLNDDAVIFDIKLLSHNTRYLFFQKPQTLTE